MKKNKEALNTSLQSAVQDIPIKYIEQAVSYDNIPDRYIGDSLEPGKPATKTARSLKSVLLVAAVALLSAAAVLASVFITASVIRNSGSDDTGNDSEDPDSPALQPPAVDKIAEYIGGYIPGSYYAPSYAVIRSAEELGDVINFVRSFPDNTDGFFKTIGSKEEILSSLEKYEDDFFENGFIAAVLTVEYSDGLSYTAPEESIPDELLIARCVFDYGDGLSENICPYIIPIPVKGELPGKIQALVEYENLTDVDVLRFRYPECFSLNASDGLFVCVTSFAAGSYNFRIFQDLREMTRQQYYSVPGFDAGQIKTILSTYDVPDEKVRIIPVSDPVSSYIVMDYQSEVGSLFDYRYFIYKSRVVFLDNITDESTDTADPSDEQEPVIVRNGHTVFFGSYPQSEVRDESLLAELNRLGGDPALWTSYEYYSIRSKGNVSDCMVYTDVVYNGEKYRGVHINEFRAFDNLFKLDILFEKSYSHGISYQPRNGFTEGGTYWYLFEPIEWEVCYKDGQYEYLISKDVLDFQKYSDNCIYAARAGSIYKTDDADEILRDENGHLLYSMYPSIDFPNYYPYGSYSAYSGRNFEDSELFNYLWDGKEQLYGDATHYDLSTIRTWLNTYFYHTAFSYAEAGLIRRTNVDNSVESMSKIFGKDFVCDNTDDYVFLLSSKEVNSFKLTKEAKASDYAYSQGAEDYVGKDRDSVQWITRSPFLSGAVVKGYIFSTTQYTDIYVLSGIRPVIVIQTGTSD